MDSATIVFIAVTIFWALVGIVVPFFIPKGQNKGIIQCSLILTASSCWLLYVVTFLVQMNPLVGPRIKNFVLMGISEEWGNKIRAG